MLSWMILLSVTARHRIEKLENENEKLRRENEKLRHEKELVEKEKEKLRQERDRLKDELDLARRAAKRQAAPFSKGEPKTDPRRPGRKPGVRYGRKGHRPIPPIVDEEIKVPLPERSPCCGGAMESRHVEDQYQTEIVRQTRGTCFQDRKSTRLNSSHGYNSYAVFCLKKKKKVLNTNINRPTLFS